jgi:hypothetical protein
MAGFDRSKYKATNIAVIKEQEEKLNALVGSNGGRADYHKYDDGANKFRAYPGQDGEPFYVPKVTSWLEVEIENKDGKKEWKKMPIFNAKVHGGYPKDLVEEYIDFVKKLVTEEYDDETERKKKINILYNGQTGTKISPGKSWVMYADKYKAGAKTFGRLEIGVSVKDQLNKLAASEDPDEPISTDPYSDPDGGRIFFVKKNTNEKDPNKIYAVSIDLNKVTPLTDEELENLSKHDSLSKQFIGVFKKSDFNKQLAGLQRYDEQHGFGAFAHDAWLDICQEIEAMIPDDNNDSQDSQPAKKESTTVKATAAPAKKAAEPEKKSAAPVKKKGDMFDEMDRKALKAFIMDQELDIQVNNTIGDEDLRIAIREAVTQSQETEPTNVLPFEKAETGVATSSAKAAIDDKIAAMRAKFKK